VVFIVVVVMVVFIVVVMVVVIQGIQSRLQDTKAVGEVQALADFFDMLTVQPDRAQYGLNHVKTAAESEAIESLLISDALFRHPDFKARRVFVDLVEMVSGGLWRFDVGL